MRWIREYKIEKPALCDELIKGFKRTRRLGFTRPGTSAKGVDKSWKDSEDASLTCFPYEVYAKTVRAYRGHVMACLGDYLRAFPVLGEASDKLGFLEPPQMQYYPAAPSTAPTMRAAASTSATGCSPSRPSSTTSPRAAARTSPFRSTSSRRPRARR